MICAFTLSLLFHFTEWNNTKKTKCNYWVMCEWGGCSWLKLINFVMEHTVFQSFSVFLYLSSHTPSTCESNSSRRLSRPTSCRYCSRFSRRTFGVGRIRCWLQVSRVRCAESEGLWWWGGDTRGAVEASGRHMRWKGISGNSVTHFFLVFSSLMSHLAIKGAATHGCHPGTDLTWDLRNYGRINGHPRLSLTSSSSRLMHTSTRFISLSSCPLYPSSSVEGISVQ